MASKSAQNRPLVVVFVYILIVKGIFAVENLEFTEEPRDRVAVRNRPLLLGCGVTGQPPLTVQWVLNGQAISPNEDRQVVNNGSLSFKSVLPKRDSGEYQCCVSNEVGRICSCPVSVAIANLPRYDVHQSPDPVQRGGVLRLECLASQDAVPVPDVMWRLGKNIVTEDDRTTVLPNGVLQVTGVDSSGAGNYRCLTQNIADKRRSPVFSVTVLEPSVTVDPGSRDPVIVAGPKAQRVRVGQTALFECLSDGDALMTTWSREDGEAIRTQDVIYLGRSNLQLLQVSFLDDGVYVCTAENTNTGVIVTAKARLTVIVPPSFRVKPENFFGPIGSTVRFSCKATGSPEPHIRWLLGGYPVEHDERLVQQHSDQSDDFVIIGIKRDERGLVQCIAENEAGSIQWSAHARVRVGPGLPTPPVNIRLVPISARSVMVIWGPPEDPGSGIIAYTVHHRPVIDGFEHQSTFVEQKFTGIINDLNPHTNYSFFLKAWSTNGPSDESDHYYITTDQSTPASAPEFRVASNTPTTITIDWQPIPRELRYGIITGYRITVRETGEEAIDEDVDASLTEYTLENLMAGRIYQVRMAASTDKGYSTYSSWVTVQTRVVVDSLPKAPHAEIKRLNYSAISIHPMLAQPEDVNLIGYKFFISKEQGVENTEPVLLPLNTTVYIVTGLDADTVYIIRLQTYTVYGDGHEMIQDITTASYNPGAQFVEAPTNLEIVTINSRAVRVTWHAPVTSQLIAGYKVRFWPRGNLSQSSLTISSDRLKNKTQNEIVISGLDPFTMYEFDMCSFTSDSVGPYCDARAARTLEDRPSTPPEDILAKPLDPHAVELQWQPPMVPNGIITHYVIFYDEDVSKPEEKWHQQARNGTAHHSLVDGLASDTTYYFKVKAGTQVGEGPPTNAVAAQTLTSLPKGKGGIDGRQWQEGMLVGVCLAFVLIISLAIFIICKRRGMLRRTHSSTSNHSHMNGTAVCTRFAANGTPGDRVYVMGPEEAKQQNGFSPMMSVLPQPPNLDTKGGPPLIINGDGPVRGHHHHHHHHHYSNGIPSRFPRTSGPCSADPDASSVALLPGSESVTNSDLGEENSQGKSEASSSSGGFSPFTQDPSHRVAATVLQCCTPRTALPHCATCCLGSSLQQLTDSSTGSYSDTRGDTRGDRSTSTTPSPQAQSQGHFTANTGDIINCSNRGRTSGQYSEAGKTTESPPARNELTWPRHTGRRGGGRPPGMKHEGFSEGSCEEGGLVWERQTPSSDGSPSAENVTSTLLVGRESDHAIPEPWEQGEDTSPDFLNRVLDEFSSGSGSTTV
ncbi:protogenin B-like [Asterias rubens]|uniref:protogenin B-like n=1 Tax=Asterias rubens TaxID=7604 RepID=UPI0014551ECA|nr:protogenin B-like [Asterias rubens]